MSEEVLQKIPLVGIGKTPNIPPTITIWGGVHYYKSKQYFFNLAFAAKVPQDLK
jgi:hypothetical protein